jgi:hypothetical protein
VPGQIKVWEKKQMDQEIREGNSSHVYKANFSSKATFSAA